MQTKLSKQPLRRKWWEYKQVRWAPAVLERSGIGSADRLGKLGIAGIVDLPGVGENYQGSQSVLIHSACLVELSIFIDHLLLSPSCSYFAGPVSGRVNL